MSSCENRGGGAGPGIAGFAVLLALLLPAAAAPQEPASPRPMDLRDFLVRVLERSPEAEAADRRRDAADHEAAALRSPLSPTVEAEGPDTEGTAQLQLRQPIRLFGQGDALERLGRARRALADRRLTAAHASVAHEAARAWVEAVAARRELALLRRTVELRRDALARSEAALRSGWGGRESVQESRLAARAAERERDAVRGAVERHRRQLDRLLGRAADEPLSLQGGLAGDDDGAAPALPVPDELPPDAPPLALARASTGVAEAELARARTSARPVPALGPMVSVGDGVDPGVSLELSLPLWSQNDDRVRTARARVEASELAARATRSSRHAEYERLLQRRDRLRSELERLRTRELGPARRAVERWTASRELGMPVTERRRRSRGRLVELRREELELQRELTRLEVEAAWRSGALLSWLRTAAASSSDAGRP